MKTTHTESQDSARKPRFAVSSHLPRILPVFALLVLSSHAVFAQSGSRTWTGAVDNDFYNGGNWSASGNYPNGNATFVGTTTNNTIERTSSTYNYLYGLYFNNTQDTESAFTIGLTPNSGTQINWGGPEIRTTAMTSGTLTDTINSNIALVGGNATQYAKKFNINTDHHLTINGNISGGDTVNYSFTKNGDGTLTLAGNNTYNVVTTVNAGTLTVANSSALGGSGAGTTVASGATLRLENGVNIASEALTLSGTLFGATNPSSVEYGGAITLGGDAAISAGGANTMTISGTIDGGGNQLTLTNNSPTITVSGVSCQQRTKNEESRTAIRLQADGNII